MADMAVFLVVGSTGTRVKTVYDYLQHLPSGALWSAVYLIDEAQAGKHGTP
jgi:hypothetical protein